MKTEQIIKDFLEKLGINTDSVEKKESELDECFRYVINTPEAAVLIGNRGETLSSLSHILKKIIDKNTEEEYQEKFFIDIGDYQNKKIQDIKNRAIILAERARFFKKNVEMPPMSAYERMIVHSTFTNYIDIETESFGRGYERRVILKYKGEDY